jgi:hypothetical protein
MAFVPEMLGLTQNPYGGRHGPAATGQEVVRPLPPLQPVAVDVAARR